MELLPTFLDGWSFTRSETREILSALSDEELQFKPAGEQWQPMHYQFGCLARTQLVYTEAVKTGTMDFGLFASPALPRKDACQDRAGISRLLDDANRAWLTAISARAAEDAVIWPDHTRPLALHIAGLAEHERLHHGQLIGYFTLAGLLLPPNFKRNWAL